MNSRPIKLSQADRKAITVSISRIIGQMQSISQIVENDKVSEQTLTQLLAVKGGSSKICKDIISKGILSQIDKYSLADLDKALNIIFKLD